MIKRPKKCLHCNKDYVTPRHPQKYCSKTCSVAANRAKRPKAKPTHEKRKERMIDNAFFDYIVRECKRAGTVEILTDYDLAKGQKIFERKNKLRSWDSEKRRHIYHICHISPVKGNGTIGLLHHDNLFIGRSLHNQRNSNGENENAAIGKSIPTDGLRKEWKVNKKTPKKKVLKKIEDFLGDKLDEFAKNHKIDTDKHLLLARRVHKSGKYPFTKPELEAMDSADLRDMEAAIKGKEAYEIPYKPPARSLLVYYLECERHKENNPICAMLLPYLRVACVVMVQQGHTGFESLIPYQALRYLPQIIVASDLSKFRDWSSLTAFDVLQGKKVTESDVRSLFDRDLVVLEDIPDTSLAPTLKLEVQEAVRQLRADLVTTGLCVPHVVCNQVTRHSSEPSATRHTATIQMTKTVNNKEKSAWHYQVLSNDSKTTSRRKKLKDCWIEMDKHSQQEPMLYMMAS